MSTGKMNGTENGHPDHMNPLRWELLQEIRNSSARAVMLHQAVADQFGLNATDHKCLNFLIKSGPVTAGTLGELTGLTTGAVTGIIDRLEQAGFVVREKDPLDRRRVLVKPIQEKIREFDQIFESLYRTTVDIVQSYSDQEIGIILDFLKKFNSVSLEQMNRMKERTPGSETETERF
jgi:DNA-binding MarR family transcriptional regulator